jgi:hypothetical protein
MQCKTRRDAQGDPCARPDSGANADPAVDEMSSKTQMAENSPGFIWRLKTEDGDATAIRMFDDPLIIVNMSVWESLEALQNYVCCLLGRSSDRSEEQEKLVRTTGRADIGFMVGAGGPDACHRIRKNCAGEDTKAWRILRGFYLRQAVSGS